MLSQGYFTSLVQLLTSVKKQMFTLNISRYLRQIIFYYEYLTKPLEKNKPLAHVIDFLIKNGYRKHVNINMEYIFHHSLNDDQL